MGTCLECSNENFLNEILEKMNCTYPCIPFHQRRKKIIIIMSDVISIYHALTKRLRYRRETGKPVQKAYHHRNKML